MKRTLYQFGAFCVDPERRELTRNGEPVALTPKAFEILLLLVETRGRLLTKEEIFAAVWPDHFVEEGNLSQNVFTIRKALGNDGNGAPFIQTIPRRGYKFVAPVTLAEVDTGSFGAGPPSTPGKDAYWNRHSPFRGLQVFEPKDSWLFYGRDYETRELCRRLSGSRVLMVVGNSGSGKSSLVRAGLIPALRIGSFSPGASSNVPWRIALFRPSVSPFDCLSETLPGALAPELGPSVQAGLSAGLRSSLPLGGGALSSALNTIRSLSSPETQRADFLLVIDQFEEIFTLTPDPQARARYIDTLLAAARLPAPSPLHLVFVLRADFYAQCLEYPELSDCLESNLYNVPPMTAERLRESIERRLALAKAGAEDGLIDLLLTETGTAPGNLALLEHALGELWKESGGYRGTLTMRAYSRIGGLHGALSRHADEVYWSLEDGEQRRLAQKILLELVQFGEGTQETSRRVRKEELLSLGPPHDIELLLTQLVSSRLVSISGEGRQAFVEVSHETLIHNWTTLRQWLARDRERLELERRLLHAAEEWQRLGHDPGALLQGARLAQAQEWLSQHAEALPLLRRFIQTSMEARAEAAEREREAEKREAAHQSELRRQAEARARAETQLREQSELAATALQKSAVRLRRLTYALAFMLLMAIGAAWLAYRQTRIEQSNTLAAQALELLSRDHGHARDLAIQSWFRAKTDEARFAVAKTFPELLTELKHNGPVVRAVFSPDGRRILTASDDKTARVWDAITGRPLFVLKGHTDTVEHAAYSPDGRLIATASFDHTARIWEAENGRLLATLRGHTDAVLTVVFSPDSRRILTASRDHTARLWNSSDGRWLATFNHEDVVTRAGFSPNGEKIVTASWDHTARIWSVEGQLLTTLKGHRDYLRYAEFSPDGQFVITAGGDQTARIWKSDDGRLLKSLQHKAPVVMARFSPDGKRIVTASEDNSAGVWNASDGRLLASLHHDGPVQYAEFSSDGRHIVTASFDRTSRLWSIDGGLLAVFHGHTDRVNHVAISPDNRRVVTASADHTIRLWALAGARTLTTLQGHTDQVIQAAFSPDSRLVVTAGADKTARVWEAMSGRLLLTLRGHDDVIVGVSVSPDGRRILTISKDKTARLWNLPDGRLLAVLKGHTGIVCYAEFSPDGRSIVTASYDSTARVWSSADGHLLAVLQGHTGTVWRARFSPDGRHIVTAGADKTARIWASDGAGPLATLQGHSAAIMDAEFSPDGKTVATASDDSTVRIWNSADGSLLATLEGHAGNVWCVRFSPDGRRIVTAGADKTARIWNTANGNLLAILEGHASGIVDVEFSPDGKLIVTASSDPAARLWNSADGSLITVLQGHADRAWHARFSPNGQLIVTTSPDHTARVWKVLALSDMEEFLAR